VNSLLVSYDETKILKELEAKKSNLKLFIKSQINSAKTIEEKRKIENYARQSTENMVKEYEKIIKENRKNTILSVCSLFIITILAHRPKSILYPYPLFTNYALNYGKTDVEYYLRYFSIAIITLIENIDEANTLYPYLQSLSNDKNLNSIRDLLELK